MTPELTVAAGLSRGLTSLAVSKGAHRAELLRRAGITEEDLVDQDRRIPLHKHIALMREGKVLSGDRALGLHFGEIGSDMTEYSVVGLIANAAETMWEGLAQFNRYGRLVVEFDGPPDRFQVQQRADGLWGIDAREDPNAFYELSESTFARMVCGSRRVGVAQLAKEVRFTHPDPGYRDEYDRIFRCPVAFDAERNEMLIDAEAMNHRVAQQPRYVFGILTQHADALLKSLEESKTTRGRVEGLLMPVLHTGEITMDAIAAKMAMSRQTLLRRLTAEGTTYEKVLDDLRHRMALDYLATKRVSVNETAYLVGFSDPTAFSRAFKRWTGTSPSSVRGTADKG